MHKLVAVLTLLCSFALPVTAEPYRIGFVAPFTGDAAAIGTAVKNGFLLGLEKLPEASRSQIKVLYQDDALQTKNSLAAYIKLRTQDKINVLLNFSSGTGNALAPLAEYDRVPFISISSDSKVSRGRRFTFNFWVTPEEEARVAMEEVRIRGYKRIVRINAQQDGQLAISAAFDKVRDDLTIELSEDYPPDAKDFKTFLAKVKQLDGIDAIFTTLLPGQTGLFVRQATLAGLSLPVFGIDVFEDPNEVRLSQGTLIGQWYVIGDTAKPDFTKEYTARFPKAAVIGAAHGYDIALLVGKAIEEKREPSSFHELLANLKDFSGAVGTYSSSGDQRFTMPAAAKVVTKDGFEKIWRGGSVRVQG